MSEHPIPAAISAMCEAVSAGFKASSPGRLEMARQTIIRDGPLTVTSLAGWHYLNTCRSHLIITPTGPLHADSGIRLPFQPALQQFARALGFATSKALLQWAQRYPKLWGNDQGTLALSNLSAYNSDTQHRLNEPLHLVIDHWLAVAQRISNRPTRAPAIVSS